MIPAVLECCAGIDVGKKFVMVCVLKGPANGEAQSQIRRFGTTNEELKAAVRKGTIAIKISR